MDDYKKQYLKYKKKYLQIKNKTIGGESKNKSTDSLHYKFSNSKFSKVLPDLNNTFLTYFVRDYSRHQADDVSDHSIWTALVLADWIQSKNKWVSKIDTKYHDILIFSAFIHDIGKTGDGDYTSLISSYKPTHHNDGLDIILGNKKYITYANDLDAALNSDPENTFYNDKRKIIKPTQNAVHNIREYSTNIETMLKIAGFTIEELFICAMIVGMVDVFEELVIEPIEKYNLNNPNKEKNENTHITLFTAYKTHFNKLFDTVKTHHSIDKISDQILSINKNTLTRMCLAVSAANVKGARIIQGKLDNLPEPTTVYPVNDTQLSSSNLKLFLNNIEERFSKYEDYYEYVDKIISQTTSKNEETENETDTKNKSPKKSKVEKNSFCSIQ
tara:strand:+ start:10111 stop:11268 length:1158 start_codon:yes stop_codon:yes gene_type:complete